MEIIGIQFWSCPSVQQTGYSWLPFQLWKISSIDDPALCRSRELLRNTGRTFLTKIDDFGSERNLESRSFKV